MFTNAVYIKECCNNFVSSVDISKTWRSSWIMFVSLFPLSLLPPPLWSPDKLTVYTGMTPAVSSQILSPQRAFFFSSLLTSLSWLAFVWGSHPRLQWWKPFTTVSSVACCQTTAVEYIAWKTLIVPPCFSESLKHTAFNTSFFFPCVSETLYDIQINPYPANVENMVSS